MLLCEDGIDVNSSSYISVHAFLLACIIIVMITIIIRIILGLTSVHFAPIIIANINNNACTQ